MKGLFRAVNRVTNDYEPKGGFNPPEKLSVHEALRAYTYGSAYAADREMELGTLETGKLADIIALENNPFDIACNLNAMINNRTLLTIMNGKVVHSV